MALYSLLKILTIFFLLLYFIKGNFELFGFIKSIKFISKKQKNQNKKNNNDLPFIYILLPVLREQKVIEETINNLLKINYPASNYKIVAITTEKEIFEKESNRNKLQNIAKKLSKGCKKNFFIENYLGFFPEDKLRDIHNRLNFKKYDYVLSEVKKEYNNFPTTIELLDAFKKKIDDNRFAVMHYPHTDGVMAHQLNYACERLIENKNNLNNYICIYNADSKIDKNTLLEAGKLIKKKKEKKFVIQQSAIFLNNYKRLKNGMNKFFVYAAGLFQSYWTFSVEIPKILRQKNSIKNKNVKLAHCVGHGLFIKLGLLKELGFFPIKTFNEDLAFGFILSANRIPIYPLKSLEIADTPETLSSLINQKKVWFYSYLEYYKARKTSLYLNSEKKLANSLFLQGSFYGLTWLINSYLLFLPIVFGLIYKEYLYFYIAIFFLLIYNFFPYFILLKKIGKQNFVNNFKVGFSFGEKTILSLFSVLIYFTDSIGPTLSICENLIAKVTNKEIKKKKTER
ncbi:MAG: glycosyltransferase [Candidatus Woesearchaeota archaeon]